MNTNTRSARVEGVVLVAILLIVGSLAGLASFTHVKDWTLDNSPTGTGEWFGWANAAISELIPTASLLTIRARRRSGGLIGYPMFLLLAAVALSLAAQLAVAKPGLSGWLLSAVPALAFLGLSKLVLSTKPATDPAHPVDASAIVPAPSAAAVEPTPVTPVEQVPLPAVQSQPARVGPVVEKAVSAVPVEQAPAVLPLFAQSPATPARPPALVPVAASSFVRHNGVPIVREAAR